MSKYYVGQRVFIIATIVNIPPAGPCTLQVGYGESPGNNISVHTDHLLPAGVGGAILPPVKTGTGEEDINTQRSRANAPVVVPSSDPVVLTEQLKAQELPAPAGTIPSVEELAARESIPPQPTDVSDDEPERLTAPEVPLQSNPMVDVDKADTGAEGQPS